MGREQDLRFLRTQQMIQSAFFELMGTIGFDKITVQNLTKKAMINRSTFYLHYMDKFDLLDKIENEMLGEIKNIIIDLPITTSSDRLSLDIAKANEIFTLIYTHIKNNHKFFTLIMGQKGNPTFYQKFGSIVKDVLRAKINLPSIINVPEKYLIALIAGIHTSLISEWLNCGMQESPQEIANIITKMASGIIKGFIPDTALHKHQ